MPLPSGTAISTANVNSYIGKSASTAVQWNTTVRMLSNDNTSPNLNGARGQSAFEIQWQTGQSSDTKGGNNTAYPTFNSCTAHLIPNSPWRVILSSSLNSSQNAYVFDLRVVGTNYGVTYRYNFTTLSTLPTGYYLAGNIMSVMLDNGKLVIVGGQTNNASAWGFTYGLYFIVLTFNTNGSIASTTHYVTTGYITSYSYVAYLGYNYAGYAAPNLCTKQGNKFMFAMSYIVSGTANYQDFLVTGDLATTTLTLTYDQTGTSLTTGNYNMPHSLPILNSNNTVSLFYIYNLNSQAYHYYNQLNSTGTTWSTGTRYAASTSYYTVTPTNGGANTNLSASSYTTGQPKGFWDSKNNYFWISALHTTSTQVQIASSPSAWYYSGTIGALSIIKTNSTNTLKYELQLTTDTYVNETSTTSKSGTTYTWYYYRPFDPRSVMAVESDSSDNSYILYRTMYTSTGSYQGSTTAAVNPLTAAAPTVQMQIYNLSKVNSSGTLQWTVQLDIGPKTLGGLDGSTTIWGDAYAQVGNVNNISWSLLANDSINAIEVYCHVSPRDTGAAYYFAYLTTQRSLRSVSLRMSDGATSTYAPASSSNISLITKYQLTTSGTTSSMYTNANNGTTNSIKLKAPQNWTGTARTSAGVAIATVAAARSTVNLGSSYTSSLFSLNPASYNYGTTFNTSPDSL